MGRKGTYFILLWLLLFTAKGLYSHAQDRLYMSNADTWPDSVLATISIEGTDTVYNIWLNPVTVSAKLTKAQKKRLTEWTRLRNAVYVTYPYAVAAARVMNQINKELVNVNDKKKRKEIIRAHEKELKKEFTSKLKNLSIYQGKVLMKLIYRQTGNNCYEIIEEYKGEFTAIFW
ncbi:MAG: DUF4294 domain-containing protein, partial [Chitinophagaceae bacterium]|nr:DUF4294 domain-containing protein [Chitinophagaceae bacterium]